MSHYDEAYERRYYEERTAKKKYTDSRVNSGDYVRVDDGARAALRALMTCDTVCKTDLAKLKLLLGSWECPINYPGCTRNCGNYGCGN